MSCVIEIYEQFPQQLNKYLQGCGWDSWKSAQMVLESEDSIRILKIASDLRLPLKNTDILTPVESLTESLLERGILGYLGHYFLPVTSCLTLALQLQDRELVHYYLARRPIITEEIWQLALNWGSTTIYGWLLDATHYDFLLHCQSLNVAPHFIEFLVDKYQLANKLRYLNWLLQLLGRHLSTSEIIKLELPKIQLQQVLKGFVRKHSATEIREFLSLSQINISAYAAGASGYAEFYQIFLTATDLNIHAQVLAGAQDAGKDIPGLQLKDAEQFRERVPDPPTCNRSFHSIAWHRSMWRSVQQKDPEYAGTTMPDALNFSFAIALEEGNFELIMEIERYQIMNYSYLLAKATTPTILHYALSKNPEYRGFDLSEADPQYRNCLQILKQHYK